MSVLDTWGLCRVGWSEQPIKVDATSQIFNTQCSADRFSPKLTFLKWTSASGAATTPTVIARGQMRIDNATRGKLILRATPPPLTQSKSCGVTAGVASPHRAGGRGGAFARFRGISTVNHSLSQSQRSLQSGSLYEKFSMQWVLLLGPTTTHPRCLANVPVHSGRSNEANVFALLAVRKHGG